MFFEILNSWAANWRSFDLQTILELLFRSAGEGIICFRSYSEAPAEEPGNPWTILDPGRDQWTDTDRIFGHELKYGPIWTRIHTVGPKFIQGYFWLPKYINFLISQDIHFKVKLES